ncbi:sensor histidine kinase [Nocardia sp. NPDC052566]|uniref:sensor histidine kinase n=1 Tax=Nocardia sp. NPDC052566 TaxID=3364330 RepID=UPI0037CB913A
MGVVTSGFADLRRAAAAFVYRAFGIDRVDASGVRRGWFGAIMAAAWLAYLIGPIIDRWTGGQELRAALTALCVLGFGALIVVAFIVFRRPDWEDLDVPGAPDRRVWVLLAIMSALSVAIIALVGVAGLPTTIYIAAVAVFTLPTWQSGSVVAAVAIGLVVLPLTVPGWQGSGLPFYLAFIPVVIWLFREIGIRGSRLQALARHQRTELALVEERNRVARDVHDILGHSLTVITVKTELAQRLIDIDIDRARTELADVERLAREALAGVRDTVGGLREVTLRGELANAASALAAADIAAELPDPAELPADSELFGWVLREAITNVVRHSAARHCTVIVTATTIEIADDGRGMTKGAGSGLSGLHERVRAAGGTLTLSAPGGGGVRVLATVPGTK